MYWEYEISGGGGWGGLILGGEVIGFGLGGDTIFGKPGPLAGSPKSLALFEFFGAGPGIPREHEPGKRGLSTCMCPARMFLGRCLCRARQCDHEDDE